MYRQTAFIQEIYSYAQRNWTRHNPLPDFRKFKSRYTFVL